MDRIKHPVLHQFLLMSSQNFLTFSQIQEYCDRLGDLDRFEMLLNMHFRSTEVRTWCRKEIVDSK